jgi:hypothetical protein
VVQASCANSKLPQEFYHTGKKQGRLDMRSNCLLPNLNQGSTITRGETERIMPSYFLNTYSRDPRDLRTPSQPGCAHGYKKPPLQFPGNFPFSIMLCTAQQQTNILAGKVETIIISPPYLAISTITDQYG